MSNTIGTVQIDILANTSKLVKGMDNAERKVSRVIGNMKNTIIGLGSAYAIFEGINKSVESFKRVENAQIAVAKTTGLVGKELENLIKQIDTMSTSMSGFKLDGLYETAEAAGQLGITGVDNIVEFTRVMGMVGLTTELSSQQSATSFAKLSNSLNEPIEKIEILASVANELSNTTSATVGDLLQFSQRLSGGAKTAGLATDEIFGLSATMTDLAIKFETGGTNVNRVMLDLVSDSSVFATAIGADFESFANSVQNKPIEALQQVLEHMNSLSKTDAANFLTDLGYKGTEVKDVLLKLSSNTQLLTKNLKIAHDEYRTGTSIQLEYDTASQGLEAQTTKMKSSFILLGAAIGSKFKEPILESAGALTTLSTEMTKVFDGSSAYMVEVDFLMATISRTTDMLLVLWEVIENGGQTAVYSLNLTLYGFAAGISKMALSVSETLNSIGFLSDGELEQNKKLTKWLDDSYNVALKGIKDSGNEIVEAMRNANVTIEERISLYQEERQAIEDTLNVQKKVNDLSVPIVKINKINTSLISDPSEEDLSRILSTSLNSWINYYEQIGDHQTAWLIKEAELKNQYADLTKNQYQELYDVAKAEYFDKLKVEIEPITLDFRLNGYDDASNAVANLGNSIMDMSHHNAEYQKDLKKTLKGTKQREQAEKKYSIAAVGTYANMTSSMVDFYDADDERKNKQSKIAEALHLSQLTMQLVEMAQSTAFTSLFVAQESVKSTAAGVTAVATAAQSSPWTGFATAAAMAAMLASFGVMLTGGKGSESSDAFSAQKANDGTGSVLGDASMQSESIQNSLELLEDLAKPEFKLMSQMNDSLLSIDRKIGGVSAGIIRTGGFALGEGFTGSTKGLGVSYDKLADKALTSIYDNPVGEIANFLTLGVSEGINRLISGAVGGVIGGFFGKKKRSLSDAGLAFSPQLIAQAMDDLSGKSYQTVKTVKKSWFSKKTSYNTQFSSIDEETERQFELILGSLYNIVVGAGEALDVATVDVENELSDFYVNLGKISLKDKSGTEIQETLTAIFGRVGDQMAKDAFPALIPFQQIGEGMFETLSRVSVGMQQAEYYINRLGTSFEDIVFTEIIDKQGDIGLEVLSQSIIALDEATYGANNGVVQMVQTINSSAEDLFETYLLFVELRNQMELLGKDGAYLTSSMLLGAGGVDELADAMNTYFESFLSTATQAEFNINKMMVEFSKLNLVMPTSIKGFQDLVSGIDISTEEGQELYGRVILLSDGFANLADDLGISMADIEDSLSSFMESMESTADTIDSIINELLDLEAGTLSTDENILKFNALTNAIETYTDTDGNLLPQYQEDYMDAIKELGGLSKSIVSGQNLTDAEKTALSGSIITELEAIKSIADITKETLSVYVMNDELNVTSATSLVGYITDQGLTPANNLLLNSFDVGTSYVQYDQQANIHKGEIIIDANSSSILRNYGIKTDFSSNNGEVASLLKAILAKLKDVSDNTKDTADVLDGIESGHTKIEIAS